MAEERWAPVRGYEGLYEASDQGKVRSVSRSTVICGKEYKYVGRVLKPFMSEGKLYVTLRKNDKGSRKQLAKVVWLAFHPNSSTGRWCRFFCKNGDFTDCSLENIGANNTTKNAPKRKKKPKYKDTADYIRAKHGVYEPEPYPALSEEERETARKMMEGKHGVVRPVVRADGKMYESMALAAREMGVSKAYMMDVVNGRANTCKGYNFRKVTEEELWGE